MIPIAVLVVVFAVLLHFTPFGRGVYEIGLNAETAHFSGVDVRRTKLLLFVISGVVASFAGVYDMLTFDRRAIDTGAGSSSRSSPRCCSAASPSSAVAAHLHGVIAGVLLIGVLSAALQLSRPGLGDHRDHHRRAPGRSR